MENRNVRCRAWCFTSFEQDPPIFDVALMDYMVFQREVCPRTQREHWQSFVVFKNRLGLAGAKRETGCPSAHFETCRAQTFEQAALYCKKADTRKEGTEPQEFGELPAGRAGQGARTDLSVFAKAITESKSIGDLIEQYPSECVRFSSSLFRLRAFQKPPAREAVKTFVFYGPTGTGKTHLAFELAPDAYRVMYGNCGTWFDGYDGQETIILDEFDGTQMCISKLLQICDKYKYRIEFKGGSTWAAWTTVFITANHDHRCWYDSLKVGQARVEALGRRVTPPYGQSFKIESRAEQETVRGLMLNDPGTPPSSPDTWPVPADEGDRLAQL